MSPFQTLNIALAGDHSLNLHALAHLLREQAGFHIVSISKNANQLSSSIALGEQRNYPHIVLLDINFDLYRAAGIISFLKGSNPDIRLAALGPTKDHAVIRRLRDMGVDGYIPKNSDPQQLEQTLRTIIRNGESAARPMAQTSGMYGEDSHIGPYTEAVTAWPVVTTTERKYFRLAMSEASNEEIRRALKLPESTFASLVTNLYRQFGVRSRDGLVLALYRNRFMIVDDL